MRIESILQTRSPRGRLKLVFEGGKELLVYPAVLAELGLYEGKELSDEGMEELLEKSALLSARERALRIISASAVTEAELLHRLLSKGEKEEHAQAALDWLRELRLLDDRRVAEQIVRSGLAKGYGLARLRQMLYEKRVPKALWEEALGELPDQEGQIEAFLQKRFRGQMPDEAECRRATNALVRRGHSWSDIRKAMERYCSMEEYLEE